MKELNFETGLITYNINGKCRVTLNPTDLNFVERIYKTFEALDKQQDEWTAQTKEITDAVKLFELSQKRDAEMRQLIDALFNEPVADSIFGDISVYAMADGAPVWANLLFAVLEEVTGSFNKELNTVNPKLEKYLQKYK